jgi:hypothetical protein
MRRGLEVEVEVEFFIFIFPVQRVFLFYFSLFNF